MLDTEYLSDAKRKTELRIFESLVECMEFVADPKRGKHCRNHLHTGADKDADWIGRYDMETKGATVKAVNSNWDEGMKTLQEMTDDLRCEDLPKPKCRRRVKMWHPDEGDEVDFDRLRSGMDYWQNSHREATLGPATITIVTDLAASSRTDHRNILWRGAAAVAMTQILEEAGYRVELWVAMGSRELYDDRTDGVVAICLKKPDESLGVSALINAVSGWFFRTVGFAAWCASNKKRTPSWGLGKPQAVSDATMGKFNSDEKRVLISNAFSKADAVNVVKKKIAELKLDD